MLIQVVKDERGNKGAALTTFISIAGKFCVLMPNKPLGIKISKKLSDFKERKKLTDIANKCKLSKEMAEYCHEKENSLSRCPCLG